MLAVALIALLVSAGATLAVPLAVRRMIDVGFSGIEPDLVNKYFATLAGIGLVLALASAARFYAVNWLGERVVADIRRDVFAHLTGLSPAFYEVSHSGEIMSRITADTTQVKAAASTAISQALRNVLLLIGAAVMMIVTSPKSRRLRARCAARVRLRALRFLLRYRAAARGLWPLGQGALTRGARHFGAGFRLCQRESCPGEGDAGLHP